MPKPRSVIAIWHVANRGKTQTLRELAKLLLVTYPNHAAIFPVISAVPDMGDFRLVVEISGRVVAVESRGDPHTDLRERLLDLANNFGADVIFCSTRTKGDTMNAVENLRRTRGFETIWTSTYQTDRSHNLVNHLKAQHIIELARSLSIL
jgi:hypothetical protein